MRFQNRIYVLIIFFVYVNTFYLNCNKSNEIKIGAILPLTGQSGEYGQWIKNALEMGREEINSRGGINGNDLIIIYEDDQAEPKQAVNAMNKLAIANKVPIVFGSWASSSVLAQAPIAESTKTPVLAEAQSPKIRDAGDYIFRIQPDSRYYLKILVPYVYKNMNIRRLAILYVNNDYGLDQANVFKKSFEDMGGQVLYSEAFNQGSIDFRTQLLEIKNLKPQGIFIPAYAEAGYIIKQASELGVETKFIGSAPLENPEVLLIAGWSAEGAIYPHHFDPESPDTLAQDFKRRYEERYNQQLEGYAALAYDAIYIIAKVLQQCGTDKECIKNTLYNIRDFCGVTGSTSFDEHGDVIKPIVIRSIVNGKFITIWREGDI